MSDKCDGSVGPKYKKVTKIRILFDGTEKEDIHYEEVGHICLGCLKYPCEEDTKKGWVIIE